MHLKIVWNLHFCFFTAVCNHSVILKKTWNLQFWLKYCIPALRRSLSSSFNQNSNNGNNIERYILVMIPPPIGVHLSPSYLHSHFVSLFINLLWKEYLSIILDRSPYVPVRDLAEVMHCAKNGLYFQSGKRAWWSDSFILAKTIPCPAISVNKLTNGKTNKRPVSWRR